MPWSDVLELDGKLIYKVDGIFGTPDTPPIQPGFVHFHSLTFPSGYTGPFYGYWLKHTAVTEFDFIGPMGGMFAHHVTPGIDFEFPPLVEIIISP